MNDGAQRIAVLIVDDEALLRMHAADIVEEAGFLALEAKNADEAIEILESRSDIALLLTDIHMPGSMDGLKLAHAVRQKWPPIKILVVSGQIAPKLEDLPEDSQFWNKPFQAAEIIKVIRELTLT